MGNYIVKINTYCGEERIRCGTGIIIGERQILTAKHVVCGNRHTVVFEGQEEILQVVRENEVAIVLETKEIQFIQKADCFSIDEILDCESVWMVKGYITDEQIKHQMTGNGIVYGDCQESSWDYYLAEIVSGKANNYEGMSGAPVISEGRIVGILQCQASNINGALGVRMSSVEKFVELLTEEIIKKNECYELVRRASQDHSAKQIHQNVKSKKYIPDIFVEEEDYKEYMRFFADPCLFVKKVVLDCKYIDFNSLNQFLQMKGIDEIDFSSLNESFVPAELEETIEVLLEKLSYAIGVIEKVERRTDIMETSTEAYYSTYKKTMYNSIQFYLRGMVELLSYAKKKYILLTKCAGQGKTNFLCDFTENFLLKKNYCVWYFNAYDFRDNPWRVLQQKLNLREKYSFSYVNKVLTHEWEKNKRPMLVIIDGLNENTVVNDFRGCIREFLEECERFPWIKVIMSTRKEFLGERFGCMEKGSYIDRYEHMSMLQTNDAFKERIFRGYMSFFNITFRTNTLTTKTYEMLTKDILLLRFFCEVNEGKKQIYMYDIYKYDVFKQYLEKKAKEYAERDKVLDAGGLLYSLLDKICAYMIESKTYFNIPVGIFERDERKLLLHMLENEVVFKEEQIIQTGLMQRNSLVISFTFDEFRDFCITNYVLTNLHEKEKFDAFWNVMNTENQTIREGVQKYIFCLAKTQYQETLLPIVKELPEYEELYWEHIWNVEDMYITVSDIEVWRKHLLEHGHCDNKVVEYLLFRYDCDFFTKANIKLLFEILDEFAENVQLYEAFTKTMFGVIQRDYYGRERCGSKVVVPFDKFVEVLQRHVMDSEWNQMHKEWYKLTVYLYEMKRYKTSMLWELLYQTSSELVIEILEEMNVHKSSLVKGNVKDILQHLVENGRNNEFDGEIRVLDDANDFGQGVGFDVTIILPDIIGEEGQDEDC